MDKDAASSLNRAWMDGLLSGIVLGQKGITLPQIETIIEEVKQERENAIRTKTN